MKKIKSIIILILLTLSTTIIKQQNLYSDSSDDLEALLEEILAEIEAEEALEQEAAQETTERIDREEGKKDTSKEKQEEQLKIEKENLLNTHIPNLIRNLSTAHQVIAGLSEHKKKEFKPYQKELSEAIRFLSEIDENNIYQNSLMDEKSKELRNKLFSTDEALTTIIREILSATIEKEEGLVERLYQAKKERSPQAREIKKRQTVEELKKEIREKREAKEKAELEQKKIKREARKKAISSSKQSTFKRLWLYIKSFFVKTPKQTEPTKTEKIDTKTKPILEDIPQTTDITKDSIESSPEDQEKNDEFEKEQEALLKFIKSMQLAQPSEKEISPTLQKLALKKLLSLFKKELTPLYTDLTKLMEASKKEVEKVVKKREEQEKWVDRERKSREQQRYYSSSGHYSSPRYSEPRGGYNYSRSTPRRGYSQDSSSYGGSSRGYSPSSGYGSRSYSDYDDDDYYGSSKGSSSSSSTPKSQKKQTYGASTPKKDKSKEKQDDLIKKEEKLKNRIIKLAAELDEKYLKEVKTAAGPAFPYLSAPEISSMREEINKIEDKKTSLEDTEDSITDKKRVESKKWKELNAKYKKALETFEQATSIVKAFEAKKSSEVDELREEIRGLKEQLEKPKDEATETETDKEETEVNE